MIIQLSDKDNAKEVLDIENINKQNDQLSSVVELLRSELLFERAIGKLQLDVSLFSRGKILTEEKYKSSSFYVQPYQLNDSSLIDQEIEISYSKGKVSISYLKNDKPISISGSIGSHLKNDDIDVVIKATNFEAFKSEAINNELFFIINGRKTMVTRMIEGLRIEPVEADAKTISISFRGYNAQLCHDLTLAVSDAFMEFDNENQRKGGENILAFINSQLDSLSTELRSSKDSLMLYQRQNNLPDPEVMSNSVNTNLTKMQDELFMVEGEVKSLETVNRKLSSNIDRLDVYRLIPEMLGKSYEASLLVHIEQLHELLESKEDLLFNATEENSKVKLVNQKIESKIQLIRRSVSAIHSRLLANAKILSNEVGVFQSELFELPEKRMEYGRLKNIQELNEKYVSLLTEKKVMYAISDAGFASSNRVLSKPKISGVPVAPNSNFIYVSFVMFGLVLGLGVMFLRYLMFNEINLLEDLENLLPKEATILGGVPLFKYNMEYSQVIVAEAPKSMMAEAMRKLRTNLSYINPNYQTIAISSSISGEGKTFVALNLAGIIAMSGKKTVILDLDMRKPKVHLGFDADNTQGMSSLIVGQCTLDQCIQHSSVENFDFITAGPIPPNPSELLLSQGYKDVINELKTMYDVIIIDNPPVGLVSDGIRNLTEADIPIYIFKSHYSKRNFADRVKELFEMKQLTKLNVILNGISTAKGSVYGYGYGYGYMEEDSKKFKDTSRSGKWYRRIFRKYGN
jgi:tyrosine-protein kinase Etk/Wzc